MATIVAQNPIYEAVRTTNIINEIQRGETATEASGDAVEGIEQIANLIITVERQESLDKARGQHHH